MTKMDELEAISRFLLQEMAELPSHVTLGVNAYQTLMNELSGRGRYIAGNPMPTMPPRIGSVYLSAGNFSVYIDPKIHVDTVSIGTITIFDVIPSLRLFKTMRNLDLPTPIVVNC